MKSILMSRMKRLAVLGFSLTVALAAAVSAASAASATVSGPSALTLAAVVASHSSVLGTYDKRAMARLFAGNSSISFPPTRKISIAADSVVCRTSDVDITARSCDLTFKGNKRTLKAREASELHGALAGAGVASEGAAGSSIEGIMKLGCTIDPNVVKQKGGGGAECTFETRQ
jgi:hypothetical protein